MSDGTPIEHVIAYLEKCRDNGYTHVAIETPYRDHDSFVMYNECRRKDEGVLIIGGTPRVCMGCPKYRSNGEEKDK